MYYLIFFPRELGYDNIQVFLHYKETKHCFQTVNINIDSGEVRTKN